MDKLIAHRGSHIKHEENSLASFMEAITKKYIGFECDIWQTKDNVFVTCHNPLYDGKLIKANNLKKLKGITVLNDVLKIKTDKIIMIDIKDPFIDTKRLLKLLNKHRDLNIYVMSFYKNVINNMQLLECIFPLSVINYMPSSINKYDFLCVYYPFLNSKVYTDNQKIFTYGLSINKIKNHKLYYIVDDDVN